MLNKNSKIILLILAWVLIIGCEPVEKIKTNKINIENKISKKIISKNGSNIYNNRMLEKEKIEDKFKAQNNILSNKKKIKTYTIKEIVNKKESHITRLLGEPILKMIDSDYKVYIYKNYKCILHIFLYKNTINDYEVMHVDIEGSVSNYICLNSLFKINNLQ